LDRLADDMESQLALQAKLIGAALYPAIVTLVALAIVTFLLAYVVPQVAGVFAGSKRSLPWLTVAMLALAHLVRTWGWLMIAILLIAGCGLWMVRKGPKSRENFDAVWLKLPVIGSLAQGVNVARFANTLALLAAAGVPVIKALQSAAETLGNRAMRRDALQMTALVREGAPLATAIQQHPNFPPLLATFASLGEQTGQLPLMLERAARQTAERVQRRAMQLATVAEPLLVVGMGSAVMLIVLAVLLPIMELNQLVR
jgi:general secretion pathway protein F